MAHQPTTTVDLSIVIPAFNESQKIGNDIRAAAHFLAAHGLSGEILVVDDGSRDGTAETASRCLNNKTVRLRVVRYERHRGKGYAVRTGMTQTLGKIILFIDSGGCTPYDQILRGMDLLRNGACDIAHASRWLPESIIRRPQRMSRRMVSYFFRKVFIRMLNVTKTLTDTQMGLKMYRGDLGRKLYAQCQSDGFLFDIEIIWKALKSGCSIREFPITWSSDPDSRLSLFTTPFTLIPEWIKLTRSRILGRKRFSDFTIKSSPYFQGAEIGEVSKKIRKPLRQ